MIYGKVEVLNLFYDVNFYKNNFREKKFSGQFAKIYSREMSQGQLFVKINSPEKNSEFARFAKILF